MATLVQGIFQGLPVKATHSPVALPFHPDEQAGTGCKARTRVRQCVMLARSPLSHPAVFASIKSYQSNPSDSPLLANSVKGLVVVFGDGFCRTV